MGFRVYEDDTQTRARINYDYEDEEFILLGSGAELAAEGASYLTVSTILGAVALSLVF